MCTERSGRLSYSYVVCFSLGEPADTASSERGSGSITACWDRNESELWFMEEQSESDAPEAPVISTSMRSNESAILIVTGLTPHTECVFLCVFFIFLLLFDCCLFWMLLDCRTGSVGTWV